MSQSASSHALGRDYRRKIAAHCRLRARAARMRD